MKSLKLVQISMCLLLLCLGCAWADKIDWEIANAEKVANPPKSVALEYKFTENEARRYDVTLAGEGMIKLPGQDQEAKLQTNTELTFVDQVMPKTTSDEVWHVRRKLTKGEMTIPEFGKLPVAAPQLEIDMDKYGAVRGIKGLDQLSSTFGLPTDKGLAEILSQLKFVGFPKNDLKVNDTWNEDYSVQLAGQKPVTIKVTSTLTGFDRVLKTDCATILTKYEAPFSFSLGATDEKSPDDGKTPKDTASAKSSGVLVGTEKGEFRTYFSYTEGKIVQSYGKIELTADLNTGEKPAEATPATKADEQPKHALDVRYYVSSIVNPAPVVDAKQPEKVGTK